MELNDYQKVHISIDEIIDDIISDEDEDTEFNPLKMEL